MKILKFGGTSVGSPDRMREVVELIREDTPRIVALSAVSCTTNKLVEIAQALLNQKKAEAKQKILNLKKEYEVFIANLFLHPSGREKGKAIVAEKIKFLDDCLSATPNDELEKNILAQGELLSTHLFQFYCEEIKLSTCLLPALDFMKIEEGEPDEQFIETHLVKSIKAAGDYPIYITQGYICKNEFGAVDNLRRGGSDYTASLIGAAIQADEIQIWTDIDGIHNNDPRVVDSTFPLHEISYKEAAELAYFGAKILHPSSVLPAQKANIPVRLLNTMEADARGTIIHASVKKSIHHARAVAAKDNITAINIRSSRMLLAYGFLKNIFEVFEKYRTPIDMITTSEVAVSLTIDNDSHLPEILEELKQYAEVEVDVDQTIVCIVGNFSKEEAGVAVKVLGSLKNIPVRMISSGGSQSNISVLIDSKYKKNALHSLNDALFQHQLIHTN